MASPQAARGRRAAHNRCHRFCRGRLAFRTSLAFDRFIPDPNQGLQIVEEFAVGKLRHDTKVLTIPHFSEGYDGLFFVWACPVDEQTARDQKVVETNRR